MGNIVLLDDLTINKIAAGEVIERPASVVKEVVENSIDAGADNISIEIKNGGISYIRITDNGKGIAEDDLEIAFERHATSKIRKAEDLETVKSMGFRGEALASIAAIARVELVSKTENSEIGHRIVVEGGKIILKEETGCPKGTSITIENLFYNTPVRYKFLKKDFTESGYIEDAVTRIALVNPNIAIKYINSGKTVIQTSGNGNMKDIVYAIYGKDIAENIINVDYTFEDMNVKGVIGNPSIARSNRTNQLFFVNKRYVKDRTLTSAAEQAFKGMLPFGKYGFLILNLEINPQKLDVNVHPAKLEVRFQEENKIFKLIYHAIKDTFEKGSSNERENKEEGAEIQNNYMDELEKINKDKTDSSNIFSFDNEMKNNENKGIGGFFKNILSGTKNDNEFSTNSGNLVEQLYRDKVQHEQDKLVNSSSNVKEDDNIDYSFTSLSKNDSNVETEEKNESENKKLFGEEKAEDLNKTSSNLEKLVRELDANLEKMNLKPRMPEFESLKDLANIDGTESDNKEGNNDINTENVDKILNEDNQETIKDSEIISEIRAENIENEDNVAVTSEKDNQENNNQANDEIDEIYETSEKIENNRNKENTEKEKVEETKEPDVKFEEMYAKMFGTTISNRKEEPEEDKTYSVKQEDLRTVENMSLFSSNSFYYKPVYKYIGIVFGTYIVIEYEKEMYIVDQQAAHERILYEKVKANYYSATDKDSQLMLLPDVINLTPKEMGIAKDNLQLFKNAGFDLEEFGENTIKLNGVPNICIDLDTRQLFLEILNEINTVARTARQEIEEKFIATIAAKAAEKIPAALTVREVDNLMQQLLKLPEPFVSPNGIPTAIRMSKIDIEKKFSRR